MSEEEKGEKMTYNEVKGNLFDASENAVLVHCISSDFELGAGIAIEFAKRGVKKNLKKHYKRNKWDEKGYCRLTGIKGYKACINLITKGRYYEKPTNRTLEEALLDMKKLIADNKDNFPITEIAMPKIGCGIDGLSWNEVSTIIKEVFNDTSLNITVYIL